MTVIPRSEMVSDISILGLRDLYALNSQALLHKPKYHLYITPRNENIIFCRFQNHSKIQTKMEGRGGKGGLQKLV